MKNYLISIIIPVYNAEKYLLKCLNSVINQTYNNLEIILVDDESTDNSSKIYNEIAKNDNRIKIFHQKNKGVSSARNKGLANCNGDYILFLDADDYLELNCIEECLKIINEYGVDIIKFNYIKELNFYKRANTFSVVTNTYIEKEKYKTLIYPNVLSTFDFSNIWNCMIKKEIYHTNKFNKNITIGEDFLYFLNCLKDSKSIYFLNKYLYHYTVNNNSITHKFEPKKNLKKLEDSIIANKEVNKILNKNDYDDPSSYLNRNNKNLKNNLYQCIEQSTYREFINYINKIKENTIIMEEINKINTINKPLFYKIKITLQIKLLIRKVIGAIK